MMVMRRITQILTKVFRYAHTCGTMGKDMQRQPQIIGMAMNIYTTVRSTWLSDQKQVVVFCCVRLLALRSISFSVGWCASAPSSCSEPLKHHFPTYRISFTAKQWSLFSGTRWHWLEPHSYVSNVGRYGKDKIDRDTKRHAGISDTSNDERQYQPHCYQGYL